MNNKQFVPNKFISGQCAAHNEIITWLNRWCLPRENILIHIPIEIKVERENYDYMLVQTDIASRVTDRASAWSVRRGSPIYEINHYHRSRPSRDVMTHRTCSRVCVPTYMRNTYPGAGSVLRAIIACRPEDSLRPVLSYPSSSLANAPRQTHDYNPSFPFRPPSRFALSF